jgi:hypothetical protein
MDCIINQLTKRAVKIDSPAGRRALKYNTKNNLKDSYECVINPRTGRAVKKDSALGRKILKESKESKQPHAEPHKTTPKRKEFSTIFSYYDNKTNEPKKKTKEEEDEDERFYQFLMKEEKDKKNKPKTTPKLDTKYKPKN